MSRMGRLTITRWSLWGGGHMARNPKSKMSAAGRRRLERHVQGVSGRWPPT